MTTEKKELNSLEIVFKALDEDVKQLVVRHWIKENNLPQISLDDIPLNLFNEHQLKIRAIFLNSELW